MNSWFLNINANSLDEENEVDAEEKFTITPTFQRQANLISSIYFKERIFHLGVNHIFDLSDEKTGDDFYGDSIKFKNAIGFDSRYDLSDAFSYFFNLKYDLETKDNILKSELIYSYQALLKVGVGIELLRSPKDESYWVDYRYNDTIYSSLNYNF